MALETTVTWGLLAAILAIDLAQFVVTLDHRGRIATVEERVEPDAPTPISRSTGGERRKTERGGR